MRARERERDLEKERENQKKRDREKSTNLIVIQEKRWLNCLNREYSILEKKRES